MSKNTTNEDLVIHLDLTDNGVCAVAFPGDSAYSIEELSQLGDREVLEVRVNVKNGCETVAAVLKGLSDLDGNHSVNDLIGRVASAVAAAFSK